ncbi:MAG: PAS domain S-box protein [Thermoguttaceae bacterium]|nr:PAS domain S-box protein [Thermoguttaceae bacterium]
MCIKIVQYVLSANGRTRSWFVAAGMALVAGGWLAAWRSAPDTPLPLAAALGALGGMALLALVALLGHRNASIAAAAAAYADGLNLPVSRILSQVLANTDASILICSREGHVLWVNDGFTRLSGYTLEEVRGRLATGFLVGPATDLSTLADLERCISLRQPYRGEILNYTRDGRPYHVAFEALPVRDSRNRVKSVIAIGRDVTDRVLAEQALCEEESRYRAIFEATTNALLIFNPEGTIIEANPAACAMYGYPREQLLGLSGEQIAHPDCRHLFHEFQGKVTAGEPFHVISRDVRRDGTEIDVEVHGAALTFQGQPALMAVLTDITEQRRVQRELQEYAEALEAANHSLEEYSFAAQAASRAKSEFLANMSHEIRTPMTAILGFAEVLRSEGDLSKAPPARIEAIDTVLRNGEHLLRLINDVLDLSKIEAGRFGVECSACCPMDVVADVQDLVQIRARAKKLEFSVEFAGPLPETIRSDATRLRQILVNLIGNAIKFTDSGSVTLRIAQLGDAEQPMLEFAVVDTGVGIPVDKLETIFQPFAQAEEHGGRHGGTGLGLTISRELSRLLGGEITVESQLGMGSTFRLRVPTGPLDGIRQIADPAANVAARHENPDPNAGDPNAGDAIPRAFRGRVLLAEDGPDNQRLIGFILRRAGAEVVVADNGQLAIDQVEAAVLAGQPFQLILMDMQMPVLDGYEATRRLRRSGCTVPIVALTAHAMKGDRLKCLDAGCDDYASKPIQRPQLLRLVSHYLPASNAAPADAATGE